MPVPVSQMVSVASYIVKQKLAGRKRFPLVLMLEPLYRCNLACAGCGKIQYPKEVLQSQLSYEQCMRAVEECPTPVVAIPGGEPLLHPEIDRIVAGLVARRRYVYLCTNALLLEEKLDLFQPSKYLSFSVHMDGVEADHDDAVCREGTWRIARRAIEAALARGHRVTTNTTLFDGADPDRTAAHFDDMMGLGVEGMMVSPGYAYDKAPDQEHFLAHERTRDFFQRLLARRSARRWRFNQSPLFIEFLAGTREYDCTPWGMPTYSVFGWQKPCYLLQEGYAGSFRELLEATRWERYGHASGNPKCRDCMVHSGFEASAVDHGFSSWRGFLAMARASLFGPRAPRPRAPPRGPAAPPPRREVTAAAASPARGFEAEASPETLRAAFEYRGHVTLQLDDGEAVEGFVTNLREDSLDVWQKGGTRTRRIEAARVRRVALTGRDPAAGQSYQAWRVRRETSGVAAS